MLARKHLTYNHGIVEFVEIITQTDEFGTPLRGKFAEQLIYRDWYRKLGVTAEDTYFANADDKVLSRKVALRGDVSVDVKWHAKIDGKYFSVYRVFYSYKRNETEVSFVEVVK